MLLNQLKKLIETKDDNGDEVIGIKDGNVKVPDRATKEWKDSNPKGYAQWFNGRSELVRLFAAKADMQPLPPPEPVEQKPSLKRAVQLMKRHRDVAFKDDGDIGKYKTNYLLLSFYGHNLSQTTFMGIFYNYQRNKG